MLIKLLIIAAVVCGLAAVPSTQPAAAPLRAMSFNVRMSAAKDGVNVWPKRKELLFKAIADFNPDLLGTQEVMADQFDEITARLAATHTAVGVARDDGKRAGEWSAVYFRTDRFDLLASGTFWLSETPDVPGSLSWKSACVRICSWARLRDRANGKEFLFANTHWDHVSEEARQNSAKLILKQLPTLAPGVPLILAGDFNTTEEHEPYRILAASPLKDTYRTLNPERANDEATFHGFKGTVAGARIDFIFATEDLTPTGAEIVRHKAENGVYPSDHYPVTAVLRWK